MATAMDLYEPFDAGPGSNVTEDGWRAMMRRGNIAGVVRGVTSEMALFADSSGMQVKVSLGEVVIEGYWGQVTSTKILPIGNNASGSTRYDLIVARANWASNVVELDVIQGVGGAGIPGVTRDSTKWEIPIGVAVVDNGAATIAANKISDARQWGGPPVATNPDDFLLFGDKLSSCSRYNLTSDAQHVNSNLYFVRIHSIGEQTVSTIRMCPTILPVGGTCQVRIFRGYRQDQLTTFIDPTTSTFLYGGTAADEHSSLIPTTTFRAGEIIVVALAVSGTSTAPTLAMNAVTATSGANMNILLNPIGRGYMTSGFKTASMPTSLSILDGTYTKRDRVFWVTFA